MNGSNMRKVQYLFEKENQIYLPVKKRYQICICISGRSKFDMD